ARARRREGREPVRRPAADGRVRPVADARPQARAARRAVARPGPQGAQGGLRERRPDARRGQDDPARRAERPPPAAPGDGGDRHGVRPRADDRPRGRRPQQPADGRPVLRRLGQDRLAAERHAHAGRRPDPSVSGAVVAAASGIGFGLFQTLNIRAVRGMDPFASTFVQIAVAAVALLAASVGGGGLPALAHAPAGALAWFAGAGVLHFVAGWTLLNFSQKRIGAARTSPLLTTVPLFGIVIAAITIGQLPKAV